jgi:hypothetical protein
LGPILITSSAEALESLASTGKDALAGSNDHSPKDFFLKLGLADIIALGKAVGGTTFLFHLFYFLLIFLFGPC